ncbi:MAG TPA: sigma 54-interacting transcriptional regulator [Methylomirabilota bacterium]|nr:sigma 54-interacting transcriptional regulator [Methylomirabilota bacterium]
MSLVAELVGESPGIVAVRERIRRLLARASEVRRLPPVLLQGETGTGKGLVARALHRVGPRAAGPFVDVNCAAIPETLLEAEMFGFERGAFTDARQGKRGLFQVAHRGTLFLDEIGLLSEGLQAKLLTVLEERTVRRLGATQSEPVDVWIIAATNADLQAATRGGRFREDLYHRLAVLTLTLPPLRERDRDVLLLAEHFLGRACADYGLPAKSLGPDAREALLAHPWPGNVRELANAMERVALLSDAPLVTADLLGLPERRTETAGAPLPAPSAPERPATLSATVESAERAHLLDALEATGWNISRAAARLGVSRNTLRYRIEKHGLRAGPSAARRAGTGPAGRSEARSAPAGPWAPDAAAAPPGPAVGLSAPMEATPGPPAPGAMRWERRRLTLLQAILDADGEPAPSGEAAQALEVCAQKVQAFGGRVEDLTPGGLVGVFGVEPVEDAPRRAALAALAIQTAARRDLAERGIRAVRVALHLGHLMIGRVGGASLIDQADKRQALAVLDAMTRGPGATGIAVSAAVRPFLARRFELTPTGAGDGEPRFRLDGIEPGGLAPARAARFVGREPELRLLRGRLESAARGQGQAVAITGEAGIGKSRLLAEFRETLAGSDVLWAAGACRSYGAAIPYLPIVEALRGLLGVADGDPPARVRDAIGAALGGAAGGNPESAACLLPLLGAGAGTDPGEPGDAGKARTLQAVRDVLLQASRQRPVVLLVEDLHWIDRTSEECLGAAVDAIAGARVLVLTTHRPGYRPPWLEKSYATQMALQPLASDESRNLVAAILGDRPDAGALVDLILAKAEGNPFFLEELARAVRDHPAGGAVGLEVPDTVEEVLLARLDRLAAEDKTVLQCAAVIGRPVPLALLRAVAVVPDEALHAALGRLQAAEFVFETRTGLEPELEFKHVLTQDVAYGSLLPAQRREVHGRIVAAIEAAHRGTSGEDAERLAYHAARAERWEPALAYASRAGAKALARAAHREAAAWLEEALAALRRLPERQELIATAIDVRFELRTALLPIGEIGRIFEVLQEAEGLARRLDDQRRLGRVWAYMTDYFRQIGKYEHGADVGQRALAIAAALGDLPLLVATHTYLGHVYVGRGDYRRAADLFQRNVAALTGEIRQERLGLPYIPAVHSRAWRVICLSELGEFAEGIQEGTEAVRLAEAGEDATSLIAACAGLGRVWQSKGEPHQAIPILERGLELSRRWHIRLWKPHLGECLGLSRLLVGEVAEAVAALQQAFDEHAALRGTASLSSRASALGLAFLAAGRLDEATRLAERALELAQKHDERGNLAYAFWLAAEVASHPETPAVAVAERSYGEAIRLAEISETAPLLARCHLGLGRLYGKIGRHSEAGEARARALDLFRRLDMRWWLQSESGTAAPA